MTEKRNDGMTEGRGVSSKVRDALREKFSQGRRGAAFFFDRINASLFSFGKMVFATLQRNRIMLLIFYRKERKEKPQRAQRQGSIITSLRPLRNPLRPLRLKKTAGRAENAD